MRKINSRKSINSALKLCVAALPNHSAYRHNEAGKTPSTKFTHIFVALRNLQHIRVAYGQSFSLAFMRELWFRGHSRGATISVVSEDSFLMHLHEGFPTEPRLLQQELERWQLVLTAPPFKVEGSSVYPVLSVGFVALDVLGPPSSSEINQLTPSAAVPLPEIQHTIAWRLAYERDMEFVGDFYQKLGQHKFALAFQPIVSLSNGNETLYEEGLLRFAGYFAERNITSIDAISTLERLGLIRRLDRSVVLNVLDILHQQPQLNLGCNISSHSATIDTWWTCILEFLASQPELASRLTIEITERSPLLDVNAAIEFVQHLQRLGCQIAIDDFGAGFTTLEYVRRARPDIIKIDSGYLRRARGSQQHAEALVRLTDLCSVFTRQVVIEGIESSSDLSLARRTAANWAQGNIFSEPLINPSWAERPLLIRNSSL
ncbi:EAL domain-containing protein [Pigmentiphaga sp. YJ18]|uniref:EAL domain-containing protein n=1 Tax=Pigmentiphaga sp. YJ18 TaxID=3134907 RepID=UPI003111BB0B